MTKEQLIMATTKHKEAQMTQATNWYNKIASLYNLLNFNDRVYRRARQEAVKTLDLQEGDTVIDYFCGTGVNFAYLLDQIGKTGHIIAVDGSAGMLEQAQTRIQKNGWSEAQFTLLQQDISRITPDFLDDSLPAKRPVKALITLALTVFPEYEMVFNQLYATLPSGTRLALMEVYVEHGRRGAGLLNWIGQADVSRRVWQPMKALVADYEEEWYSPHFVYIQGSIVVASGVKDRKYTFSN